MSQDYQQLLEHAHLLVSEINKLEEANRRLRIEARNAAVNVASYIRTVERENDRLKKENERLRQLRDAVVKWKDARPSDRDDQKMRLDAAILIEKEWMRGG